MILWLWRVIVGRILRAGNCECEPPRSAHVKGYRNCVVSHYHAGTGRYLGHCACQVYIAGPRSKDPELDRLRKMAGV